LALLSARARLLDLLGDQLDELAGGPAGFEQLNDALDLAADQALVAQHAVPDSAFQGANVERLRRRVGDPLVHRGAILALMEQHGHPRW
jgi:hypothetical protein